MATAVLHASWNFATRKSEGSLAVLWLSLTLAGLVVLPAAVPLAIGASFTGASVFYIAATGIVHAVYFSLLAKAYQGGDISLVYPIARGTGVAGTAVVVTALAVEEITPVAAAGIACVCGGILLIGLGHKGGNGRHSKALSVVLAALVGLTVIGYNVIDKLAVSSGAGGAAVAGQLHPLVYVCAVFLGSSLFMAPYVLRAVPRGAMAEAIRARGRYVLAIGPASLCTYLPILFAYQLEKASSIVAFREFSVVIGSALGFAFLGERPAPRKVAGIAIVATGLTLIKLG